jgi:hypothetical protein
MNRWTGIGSGTLEDFSLTGAIIFRLTLKKSGASWPYLSCTLAFFG